MRPEQSEGRLPGGEPATKSLSSNAIVPAEQDPRADVEAAGILADHWAPALSHSFHMGQECGFRKGQIVGRAEEREAWNEIIGVYAEMTNHPTRAAIEAAQAEPIRRCGRPSCGGYCSADIRVEATEKNRLRYNGCDDHPGGPVRWAA